MCALATGWIQGGGRDRGLQFFTNFRFFSLFSQFFAISPQIFRNFFFACLPCVLVGALCVPCAEVLLLEA